MRMGADSGGRIGGEAGEDMTDEMLFDVPRVEPIPEPIPEPVKPKSQRERTPDEQSAIAAFTGVGFPAGSWDKRFIRNLREKETISEKEAPQLWRLFVRYRRQICCPEKHRLMTLAELLAAPDFRKVQAAENLKARIEEMRKAVG